MFIVPHLTFALTEKHAFCTGAECEFQCYEPLHREGRDKVDMVVLLSTFFFFGYQSMNYDPLYIFFSSWLLEIWLCSLGDAEKKALKDFVSKY